MAKEVARRSQASIPRNTISTEHTFLPVLYCTPTIQRRAFHVSTTDRTGTDWKTSNGRRDVFPKDSRHRRDRDKGYRHLRLDRDDEGGSGRPGKDERHNREPRRDLIDGGREERRRKYPEARPDRERKREFTPRIDHVPFEGMRDNQDASLDFEKSTVTPAERKTFQKLFDMRRIQSESKASGDDKQVDLDGILETAVDRIGPKDRAVAQFPPELQPMADAARDRRLAERENADLALERLKADAIQTQLNYVQTFLDASNTDLELWQNLTKHVLNRIAALDLDQPAPTPRALAASDAWRTLRHRFLKKTHHVNPAAAYPATDHQLSELALLTATTPPLLAHYHNIATRNFPGSTLPLNLLPTLRALGPSAFAFAASTAVYNAHMTLSYTLYGAHAVHGITETLAEMERGVYGFDEDTLALVLKVLKDAKRGRAGLWGPGLAVLWGGEGVGRAVREVVRWREVVENFRMEGALRKAREVDGVGEDGVGFV
ncbi:hypothetical protein B0A50_07470 [Salinomyces thailandicus]|uniref:Mtf2-like C-terminal domain-containing protein n=1 Tax=Salinomyces thailandicus TaxID=706561 RepID=A0A4U0TP76_9PEZI|nr:hypothetical protein B0A50_07470 [Salinomyces thailandica]